MSPRTTSRSTPVVALLTDFGMTDHYVAAMKGVITSHVPDISIIDISHTIEPGHIRSGAYALWAVHTSLPKKCVCIAVVDPGVGTERDILCADVEGRTYLAPDNGLMDILLASYPRSRSVTVSMRKVRRFLPEAISATFHGRDIFAPIGARLAAGMKPEEIGTPRKKTTLPEWRVSGEESSVSPAIMSVDRFGNIVTNIASTNITGAQKVIRAISVGKVMISVTVGTFAGAPENTPCIIAGSSGLIEIIVRNGSAAEILRANDRSTIRIVWDKDIEEA